MEKAGHCGTNPETPGERAETVARFRLFTGHDFWGVYLHWLGVADNETCPFCGYARRDGDHLLQFTGLIEYPVDDIASRYWETRSQMGVG
ncbi:hypothetical protein TNCV_4005651 [Trichonephila clavipes]|nr:hypothetical protein TNCV_4005651 [Trichonephila clavipes]